MLRLTLFLLCFLTLSIAPVTQSEPDLIAEQQKIIATLSGHQELSQGVSIVNRSSAANRELTRSYLSDLIEQVGITAEVQTYEMPNLNPLIDLFFRPFKGANVYGILPATVASEEYVILGAHFDTERNCPGAIDNGSGIALIYSAWKNIAQLKVRKKNVMLVFFDQEEEELIGSKAFAKWCKKQNHDIHSVHTFDTIGWDRDNDRAVELELPSESLEERYKRAGANLAIPTYVTKVNSTDHHSFRELGYNAVGLTDEYVNGDYAPYKDTPEDKYDTVNFAYLASCTSLVFEVIKEIVTE